MILRGRKTILLRKQVEELLSQTYHTPVSLQRPHFMSGRPKVCRFVVRRGPDELGNSLVVKQLRTLEINAAQAARYPSSLYLFFNDWAGLQFLTQEVWENPISPRFYAADREMELIVMEDIQPESDGSSCLKGKDSGKAEEKLLLWASTLGTLHARTIGKQAIFDRIRDAITPSHPSWGWVPPWQRTLSIYEDLLQTLPANIKQSGFESFQWMRFVPRQAAEALSLPMSSQAEIELERVMHACACWVLMLCQFNALSQYTAEDQAWGPFTMRQRILTRFDHFAQTTAEYGYLEALGSLFHMMGNELRKRWPAHTQQLPIYPTFKNIL